MTGERIVRFQELLSQLSNLFHCVLIWKSGFPQQVFFDVMDRSIVDSINLTENRRSTSESLID